jgi:bifunctional DNase/RNase
VGNEFKDIFGDWEPSGEGVPSGSDPLAGEPENRVPRALNEKEVKVVGVYEHAQPGLAGGANTFVLLQDNHGRKVFIFIGRFEAMSISMALEGEETERPMTHDLMKQMLDRLGATIERVIIDDIWQDTFYAKLSLSRNGDTYDIDCRPSDAVALAVRARAPIYMAESVIEASQQEG